MRLKGIIHENLIDVSFSKNRAFSYTEYVVYELFADELIKIQSVQLGCVAYILCDGLWQTCDGVSRYSDIFNYGLAFPDIDFNIGDESSCIGRHLIAEGMEEELYRLSVVDLNNLENTEVAFSYPFTYSFDVHNIFVRTNGYKELTCYDYALNKQWEYTLEGQVYIDFERKPQLHNDLVIINHAEHIIALNKETGQEVWKFTFEDIPSSNILMEGKIFAVCKAIFYIIDPDTGEVELERDTGLPARYGEANYNRNEISIVPFGDYLYCVSLWPVDFGEKTYNIFLFNRDASKILDKQYTGAYYISPYRSILPTVHCNKVYQPVRNGYSFSESGMLVLELSDSQDATITVPPHPPVTILATPALSETHKLQIYLDVDNLDDALRYGNLVAQELFYATGYVPLYELRENALDRKHNGVVELIVDDTGFDDRSDEYLDDLAEEVNERLDNSLLAGDKKTRMRFKLIKQKKSEWTLSGERLDWPAIRDQETPLG